MYSGNQNLVLVTGRYLRSDGTPQEGYVSFTPSTDRLLDGAAKTTIMQATKVIQLDAYGAFREHLPATDDPDITPTGFTYTYKELFEDGTEWEVELPLALADSGVDVPSTIPQLINQGFPQEVTLSQWNALVSKVEMLVLGLEGGAPDSVYFPSSGLDGGSA